MYRYKIGVLKCLACNYIELEDGIQLREGKDTITDPWSLAEYKCDFENGLSFLGEKFNGVRNKDFKDFRNYPDIQRVVLADVLWGSNGIANHELIRLREGEIIKLRHSAYKLMMWYLNGKIK